MKKKSFDLVILGAGPAGYVAALRATQNRLKTALIEKEAIGGMCLNWGCLPSKTLIASAKLYETVRNAREFGLSGIDFGKVRPDWKAMNRRAQAVVARLTGDVKSLLEKNGLTLLSGQGKVVARDAVRIKDAEINFEDLVIATGSLYPFPDFVKNEQNFYTPKTIYSLDRLPGSITIIGAGVVGVEFALLFSSLRVSVNLIEQSKNLMPYIDEDLQQTLLRILGERKVKLSLGWKAVDYSQELTITDGKARQKVTSEVYLSAIAREANLSGLNYLLKNGMELTKRGFIKTDTRCRTTLPHIYAAGDVNGRFMLAHVASREGMTAVESIAGQGKDLVYDMMPYNLYGRPEIASVGLTQKGSLERGFLVETVKFRFDSNAKALAEGTEDGFVKIVYDKKYKEILGVHIIAENATDLIGEAVLAMQFGSTLSDIASVTHPHPALSEAFVDAVLGGMGRPVS